MIDVGAAVAAHTERIRARVPEAAVHLSGSASVAGLDAQDVDLVVLTRVGTLGDAHHRLAWRLLGGDPILLAEYRALKATPEDYERRKAAFFERVVVLL